MNFDYKDLEEEFQDDDIISYFEYLDELRESGETNMYGATSYIMEEFSLTKSYAREILRRWMETYSKRMSGE